MSIEGIKTDFYNYLIDSIKKPEDKEEIGKLSDFSIFKYSKEFKEFLTDEYKVSSDVLSMSITDILKLEVKNGKIIKEEDDKSGSEDPTADTTDPKADKNPDMVDILNLMMEDEEFKNIFDENKDGEISDKEFKSFLDTVKELDENEKDISLDDIIKAADNDIPDPTDPNDTPADNTPTPTSGGGGGYSSGGGGGYSSGGGGYSGGGSGGYSGGSSGDGATSASTPTTPTEQNPTTDYEGLSVDELQEKLNDANGRLSDATDSVTDAERAVTTARETAQDNIDEKYEAYMNAIDADEETKNAIKETSGEIKSLENRIQRSKDLEKDYKEKKTNAEKNIKTQENIIKNCTSTISTLEGKVAALRASLSNADEEDKSSITGQIANLEAQIQSLMQQKTTAQESKEKSEKEVKICEGKINGYRKDVQLNERQLTNLNIELNGLEAELIGDGTTEYAQAKQAYEDAKAAYPEACQEAESALTQARENVTSIQTEIDAINEQLTIAIEEEAEEIEVETSEDSEEFLSELLALDGIDETEEAEDVEEPEDVEASEDTEESEDKKGKIDTLCKKLNMSRQEVGVYLKSIADANNLDANEMYNKISEFIEETENLEKETDILSQYGIDSDKAERYLEDQEPNIDYNTENCIDSAIKLFELNIAAEDIVNSDNTTVQEILESYNNLSPENFESEYLYEDAVRQVLSSIEFSGNYFGENLSAEDQIDLFKEIAKDNPDIVSNYLQSYGSYFINNSMTTLLSDENAKLKDGLNLLSDLQELCGDNYNVIDKFKENGTFTDIGLELYKKIENYEDLAKLIEYINPQDLAEQIQEFESFSTETKDLQKLFTALSNIQPDASNYEAYGLSEEKANELAAYYNFEDSSWFNASTFAEITEKYSENEVLFILNNIFPDTNDLISTFRDKSKFSYDEQETYLGKLAELYSFDINSIKEPSTESADEETEPSVTEEPSTEPADEETDPSLTEEPSAASVDGETDPSLTEEPSAASVDGETDPSLTEEPSVEPEKATEPELADALSDNALAQEFLNAYNNLDKNDTLYTFNVQKIVNGIMFPSGIGNEFYETGTELSLNDQIYLLKEISKENGDIVQQSLRYDCGQFAENTIFQMASDDNCTIEDICQFKTEYEELVNGTITLEDKLIEDNYAEIVLSVYERMETPDDFIKVNEFFSAEKLASYIQSNKSKEYETDCLSRLFASLSKIQPDTENCENYGITEERKLELLADYNINKDEWFNGKSELFTNLLNLPQNEALYVLKNAFPNSNEMIEEYFRKKSVFSYDAQEAYLLNLISIYSTYIQLQPPEPIIE